MCNLNAANDASRLDFVYGRKIDDNVDYKHIYSKCRRERGRDKLAEKKIKKEREREEDIVRKAGMSRASRKKICQVNKLH